MTVQIRHRRQEIAKNFKNFIDCLLNPLRPPPPAAAAAATAAAAAAAIDCLAHPLHRIFSHSAADGSAISLRQSTCAASKHPSKTDDSEFILHFVHFLPKREENRSVVHSSRPVFFITIMIHLIVAEMRSRYTVRAHLPAKSRRHRPHGDREPAWRGFQRRPRTSAPARAPIGQTIFN